MYSLTKNTDLCFKRVIKSPLLFPVIWGKQKEFYDEVDAFIKNTYHVESTLDINDMNVMNMFKKK